MRQTLIDFFSNMISVILGIVITFSVQGMIDRAADRREVRSALELVRTELVTNVNDISLVENYLYEERKSAQFFLNHRQDLSSCPEDSVSYCSGVLFADVSITLCQDALQLLKMSSLFQKIEDNPLSMKIIRAYDCCESIASTLNHYFQTRDARFENSVTQESAGKYAKSGFIDIRDYLQTDYGLFAIRWITARADPKNYTDVSDVQAAVEAIDNYLGGRHRRNKRNNR